MSTSTKLAIANVLMLVGAVPLACCVAWLIGTLAWIHGYRTPIPIMDPLGMMGPFVLILVK